MEAGKENEITSSGLSDYINLFMHEPICKDELFIANISDLSENADKQIYPIRLNAFSILLLQEGEITLEMDCRVHHLAAGSVMEMGIDGLVEKIIFSSGVKGHLLLVSRDLMKEVINSLASLFPGNTLKLKLMYPSRRLDAQELRTLTSIFRQLGIYIADQRHFYRRQLIKNMLGILIMELNQGLWKRYGDDSEPISGYHSIKEQFRQLLLQHCKEEHEVSFYANKLCVTPDHLSKVMRNYSGRSAAKWIDHMLVTEAKIMLRKPNRSVQEVAEELRFSDQSAFGKFFRKQTGISPMAYKKGK